VLAFESDLLEYPDIFAGSSVMEAKVRELTKGAQNELDDVVALGGAFAAIDELKSRLVASQSSEWRASSRASRWSWASTVSPKPMSRHWQ